jgi:hypothetical protein
MYKHNNESYPDSIEDFEPGEFIELASIDELAPFENLIALDIQPHIYSQNCRDTVWNNRSALRDLIRPPKFNGNIKDIVLEVVSNPTKTLLDANERGLKFIKGPRTPHLRILEISEKSAKATRGFVLTANTNSSVEPPKQLRTEIWYVPTPSQIENRNTIHRYITQPTREIIPTVESEDTSINMGQVALHKSVLNMAVSRYTRHIG